MKKVQNWVFIPLSIIVVIVSLVIASYYNTLQTLYEKHNATAAEVVNQYQRRTNLITALMNTVQEYTTHELNVLQSIDINLKPSEFTDSNKLQVYENTQQTIGKEVSKLLITAEQYPDLKSNILYQNLMVQLEGSENRIAVARKRYIQSVNDYNTTLRKIPYIFLANIFGYQPLPQLKQSSI